MGTYAYSNGIIRCESELTDDIVALFATLPLENVHWHRNDGKDYLLCFDIKENRLEALYAALDRLGKVKTKDSVLGEWYDIEVDILTRFDSDADRIDVIEIRRGELRIRRAIAQQSAPPLPSAPRSGPSEGAH